MRKVVDSWSMATSNHKQITWFSFPELVIISLTSNLDKLSFEVRQSRLNMFLNKASERVATISRMLNIVMFSRCCCPGCSLSAR